MRAGPSRSSNSPSGPTWGGTRFGKYLDWYLDVAAPDRTRAEKLHAWPVSLARFLAGDIGEAELLATADLDKSARAWRPEAGLERLRESHFVLAEWALAQEESARAETHLRLAIGLPAGNPMSWVAARRSSDLDAT